MWLGGYTRMSSNEPGRSGRDGASIGAWTILCAGAGVGAAATGALPAARSKKARAADRAPAGCGAAAGWPSGGRFGRMAVTGGPDRG